VLRALAIGVAGGGIVWLITNAKASKKAATVAALVALAILTVLFLRACPWLVAVPDLSGLSRAEAEEVLSKRGLGAEPRPQYSDVVEAERVIPRSQEPAPGIKVRRGAVVRFGVSTGPPPTRAIKEPSKGGVSVTLFRPKSGERAVCIRDGEGIYRFDVEGVSSGVYGEALALLLWVQPVSPRSETPGWYLQRAPVNGVRGPDADGSWKGVGQLGNRQWPPHGGDTFNVAIAVAPSDEAEELMARPGVVTRMDPVGFPSDAAMKVVVEMQ
jgi:hypothetical protein